jgi:addiction module RelE/StbE family toxin
MKLRWSARASQDLLDIHHYISRDNPQTARTWIKKLRTHARRAAESPLAGRMVPEFDRSDIREVLFRSYRIVYRVKEDAILILTVFEGHRLLKGV